MGQAVSNTTTSTPATGAAAVSPHNSNELTTYSRALYIGGGDGTLSVTFINGDNATFAGLVTGAVYPFAVKIVKATGTGATDIVALY